MACMKSLGCVTAKKTARSGEQTSLHCYGAEPDAEVQKMQKISRPAKRLLLNLKRESLGLTSSESVFLGGGEGGGFFLVPSRRPKKEEK